MSGYMKPGSSKLRLDDSILMSIAMNAGSPTKHFPDSPGYAMLMQNVYDAQLRSAKEADAPLRAFMKQKSPKK